MNIVVLISGSGSNLQAIIDASKKDLPLTIQAVISNNPNAYGLERARQENIPMHAIDHRDFESRDQFDMALQQKIEEYKPDMVVLAGFMRKLGTQLVLSYAGKMLNIHPSLLPKYPGLNTHQRVLANGDKKHGVSIHFVTPDLDAGPLIAQAQLAVQNEDTEENLRKRTLELEHHLYPAVLKLFTQGRIRLEGDNTLIDNKPIDLSKPLITHN